MQTSYRPPPISNLVRLGIHELQKHRHGYKGWTKDFVEFALVSILCAEIEAINENDESTAPLLKKLADRGKFLSNKIYFLSEG